MRSCCVFLAILSLQPLAARAAGPRKTWHGGCVRNARHEWRKRPCLRAAETRSTPQLLSHSHSQLTAHGLGFLLNDKTEDFASKPGEKNLYGLIEAEANAVAPHKTPLSSMAPTIITKNGNLYMVRRSPGGPMITHQWMPDTLPVEKALSPDTIDLLKQRGHGIRLVPQMGEVAGIRIDGQWIEGATDRRVEATAEGY